MFEYSGRITWCTTRTSLGKSKPAKETSFRSRNNIVRVATPSNLKVSPPSGLLNLDSQEGWLFNHIMTNITSGMTSHEITERDRKAWERSMAVHECFPKYYQPAFSLIPMDEVIVDNESFQDPRRRGDCGLPLHSWPLIFTLTTRYFESQTLFSLPAS